MRNKLPVYIDNNVLPIDNYKKNDKSYGYVSVLYLGSLIITIISLLSILYMWYR